MSLQYKLVCVEIWDPCMQHGQIMLRHCCRKHCIMDIGFTSLAKVNCKAQFSYVGAPPLPIQNCSLCLTTLLIGNCAEYLCTQPYFLLLHAPVCQWLLWHLILLLVIDCIPFYTLSADNLQLNCLSHLNLKVSPLLWAYWDLWHWCTWNLSRLYVASLPGHYKKISLCHELSHFSWHFSRCLKPHCVHVHTCAWCIDS